MEGSEKSVANRMFFKPVMGIGLTRAERVAI
jgi:hypothetical protein